MVLMLVQASITSEQSSALETFANGTGPGGRDAHVDKYAFKSGNVIELLKTLKMKFEDDSLAATKAETNSINAYKLAKKARDNAIDAADDSKTAKELALSNCQEELADAKSEKADTEADLEADTATLEETEKSCRVKTNEWNERSKTRAHEIEAIEAAIGILEKVTEVRTENHGRDFSFLQVSESKDPKMKAVNLLRSVAKVTHAKALERLAQQIQAHLTGPFDEINQMVQKMIFRLMSEQKDEDDHKNWCDLELEKTNAMKDNKEDKIEKLEANLQEAKADVQDLAEEIKAAETMISEIDAHVKESTDIRNEGKSENAISLK